MSRNRSALRDDGTLVEYAENEVVQSSHHTIGDEVLDIFEWCNEHEVDADILWGGYDSGIHSEWGIKDDNQRTLFALRWI